MTRTERPIWLLRELGLDFEVISDAPLISQALPGAMQKQPVVVDTDGTVSIESLAINVHLAEKYAARAPALCAHTSRERALTLQLTVFAMTELDPRLFELLFHSARLEQFGHPLANDARYAQYFGRRRTAKRARRLNRELVVPLRAIESTLEASEAVAAAGTADAYYLLPGRGFTVVDLNVSVVLGWARITSRALLRELPRTADWLARCLRRDCSLASRPHDHGGQSFSHFDEAAFERRYASLGCIDGGAVDEEESGTNASKL
eukprot:g4486.t1